VSIPNDEAAGNALAISCCGNTIIDLCLARNGEETAAGLLIVLEYFSRLAQHHGLSEVHHLLVVAATAAFDQAEAGSVKPVNIGRP